MSPSDAVLLPQNFEEEIKQWTNVFGVCQTPVSNVTSDPETGYSRAFFGPNVQAILAQDVGHTVPGTGGPGDTAWWYWIYRTY